MRLAWATVLLAGCGRLAFDPASTDAPTRRGRSTLTLAAPMAPLADVPVPVVLTAERADLSLLTAETFRAFAGTTELAVDVEAAGPPFVAWVRVPMIDVGTQITIEYGGPPTTHAAVWDASYIGVWHMTADGKESGSANHAATPTRVTEIAGLVGPASSYSFDAGSCMVVPSLNGHAFSSATIEGWIDLAPTAGGNYYTILTRQLDDTAVDDFIIGADDMLHAYGSIATTNMAAPSLADGVLTRDQWHHIAFTYDGATSTLYVDGTVAAAGPGNGTPDTSARPVFIGCGRNSGLPAIDVADGDWVDGAIDEVRFETTARSAAWIHYEYASGLDQVITYGPVEHL